MKENACNDRTATLASLEEALRMAQPGGFIRLFVDLGSQIMFLLSRLSVDRKLQEYIDQIRLAYPVSNRKTAAAYFDCYPKPLTSREMQILELLKKHLTNKEIAIQLVIAPGTVKAHTIRIFKKLGVNNRRQAVEIAISLGFLQPS